MQQTAQKKPKGFLWAFGFYGALGFQLALSVTAGLLAGSYGDRRWGWEPWGVLAGLVLGSLVGFAQLFKLLAYKDRLDQSRDKT